MLLSQKRLDFGYAAVTLRKTEFSNIGMNIFIVTMCEELLKTRLQPVAVSCHLQKLWCVKMAIKQQ